MTSGADFGAIMSALLVPLSLAASPPAPWARPTWRPLHGSAPAIFARLTTGLGLGLLIISVLGLLRAGSAALASLSAGSGQLSGSRATASPAASTAGKWDAAATVAILAYLKARRIR